MRKMMLTLAATIIAIGLRADIKVSDVEVFSGYPWKEVVIAYTISGTDPAADFIHLTATDKSSNKTYTVASNSPTLTGANLSEGRHIMRWNAASRDMKFSSSNVVIDVAVVSCGRVQLWKDGPYWAECNVGATKPEEYGYYFCWGDTVGYKRNDANNCWVSIKDGSSFSFSRGNCPTGGMSDSQLRSAGYIDSTGNLTAAHDAATAHLGAPWRMPTSAELKALLYLCDATWTTRNGVRGCLVTGRGDYSSKSIFLPAAGYGYDSRLYSTDSYGYYWSSTPDSGDSDEAWYLFFNSSKFNRANNSYRYGGRSVRPVRGFAQ